MLEQPANIALLLLAAGASSRMGQPKQLLRVGDQLLLEKMARAALASSCHPVVVVLGAFFEKIRPAVAHLPVEIVQNENWVSGMGNSISCGIQFLEKNHPEVEAVLLMLCDQPSVMPEVLKKLVQTWRTSGAGVVASAYAGTVGPPAVFERRFFAELAALTGGQGAKPVLAAHKEHLLAVPFPEGQFDLDFAGDLEKWTRRSNE